MALDTLHFAKLTVYERTRSRGRDMGTPRMQQRMDRRGLRGNLQVGRLFPVLHGTLDQRIHGLDDTQISIGMAKLRCHDEQRLWASHMGFEVWGRVTLDRQTPTKLWRQKHMDGRRSSAQQFALCIRPQHVFKNAQEHNQCVLILQIHRHHRSAIRVRRRSGSHRSQHRRDYLGHRCSTNMGQSGIITPL